MSQNDPFESDIFEMFGADLSGVGSQIVVGAVLGGDLVLELLVVVEGEDGGDVEEDGGDDDVCVGEGLPTLLGLNWMLLTVLLTKLRASAWVKLDFQLPAIILLFLENRKANLLAIMISYS